MRSVLHTLSVTFAVLTMASLSGVLADLLPSPAVLFAGLLATRALAALASARGERLRAWIREHEFAAGLALLVLVTIVLQVNGLWDEIGRSPLDIDEHRLAGTVRDFFVLGVIPHETVEDYPGVYYWLVVAVYLPFYVAALSARAVGSFEGLSMQWLVAVGRGINVPLYAAVVAGSGYLGRRCAGTAGRAGNIVGWATAALLAFSSMGSRITGQFRNEAGVLLLISASLLAATMLLAHGRRRDALLSGALAGLACGVKYTGGFALLPVLGAAFWRREGEPRAHLAGWGLGSFVAALGLSNPFLWLDFDNLVRQLATEVDMTGAGHWAATDNPAGVYTAFLGESFGIPALLLAAAVAVWAMLRPLPELRLLLLFWLPYQAFMTRQESQFERWVYLLLPAVACLVARGALEVGRQLLPVIEQRAGNRRTAIRATALIVGAVIFAPAFYPALVLATRRLAPSTFDLTERWLAANVAPEDNVLLEVDWLDLEGADFEVVQTGDLRATLSESPLARGAFVWAVVPEPLFGVPELDGLEPATVILARRGLGGNMGFDFAIYRLPSERLLERELTIDFVGRRGRRFVAGGWKSSPPGSGMPLSEGPRLYLPLVPGRAYDLRLHLATARDRVIGDHADGDPGSAQLAGLGEIIQAEAAPPAVEALVNGIGAVPTGCRSIAGRSARDGGEWRCDFRVFAVAVLPRVDVLELAAGPEGDVVLRRVRIAQETRLLQDHGGY